MHKLQLWTCHRWIFLQFVLCTFEQATSDCRGKHSLQSDITLQFVAFLRLASVFMIPLQVLHLALFAAGECPGNHGSDPLSKHHLPCVHWKKNLCLFANIVHPPNFLPDANVDDPSIDLPPHSIFDPPFLRLPWSSILLEPDVFTKVLTPCIIVIVSFVLFQKVFQVVSF